MELMPDFLKTAASHCGFVRERYEEAKIPTSPHQVHLFVFFSDLRAQVVWSTLLLHQYLEKNHCPYPIVCSFPGQAALYPYAGEFWGLANESQVRQLWGTPGDGDNVAPLLRQLRQYFKNVTDARETFDLYYQGGLTEKFFADYGEVRYRLPPLGSPRLDSMRAVAAASPKVVFQPTRKLWGWRQGGQAQVDAPLAFWVRLVEKLQEAGFVPIAYQNENSYDLSVRFESRCNYLVRASLAEVLAAMRWSRLVLDVFNDLSRLALVSRCPFVSCVERARAVHLKDYELDDLCSLGVPHQYCYGFTPLVEAGQWEELLNAMVAKLHSIDVSAVLPGTNEVNQVVSYDQVRQHKRIRIGSRFLGRKVIA